MQGKKHKSNSSGVVHLQDDIIYWDYDNKNILQINFNDIIVIGEYTNTDGPYFDDWFLTFVTKDGQWQSIPWYADNIDELTEVLCKRFLPDLNVSFLTGSTEWESVIRYPKRLNNEPLFKLISTETYKEPKRFFDKLLSSIGLGGFDTTNNVDLTDEVKKEIKYAS